MKFIDTIQDYSPTILRAMTFIIVLLVPLAFLSKGTVLIEAEISYIEVPKVFIFRLITTLALPFLLLSLMKEPPKLNVVYITTTLFVLWYFVATLFSQNPLISFWGEFFGQDSYSSLATAHYYFLFLMVVIAFRERTDRDKLFLVIGISGALASLPIILQHYNLAFNSIIPDGVGRPPGTFANPVFAGAFLSLCLMCTIYLMDRIKPNTAHLTLLGSLGIVQLAALVFTQTRASLLAVTVFLGIFGIIYLTKHHSFKILGTSVLVAVILGALVVQQEGLHRFKHAPQELSSRTQYWSGAVKLASFSPISGLGPDTFRFFYLGISPPTDIGLPEEPDHAHSWYFHHLAETGYVGAFLATTLTVAPIIVAPQLSPIFIARSTEQVLSVGRISDILLLFIILGVAYHESSINLSRLWYSSLRLSKYICFKLSRVYIRRQ